MLSYAGAMAAIVEVLQREEEERRKPPTIEISADQLLPRFNRKERRAQKAQQRRLKR